MSPKDKAIEIYTKYCRILEPVVGIGELPYSSISESCIILVNEIIDLEDFSSEGRQYWEDVKRELGGDIKLEVKKPCCCENLIHRVLVDTFPYGDTVVYDECPVCKKEHNFKVL